MAMMGWMVPVVAILLVGCSKELNPDSDVRDTDTSDVDTTDIDNGTDDPDSDTIDDALVNCRSDYDTPAPGSAQNGGECTTDEVFCGDFIQASTVGGSTVYDTDQYLVAGLAVGSENWDAPERAYNFRQPVGQAARITFFGPCADMDIAACQGWECSTENEVQQGDCSAILTADGEGGSYRDFPAPSSGPRDFELIVDGRDGDVGNFAIRIECFGG